tara:strand:+ start:281 stop:460 length:180 start_codon:yes stop_codon:yes gene_type:complete
MEATVLLDADNLVDSPTNEIKPGDGSREGKARDNRVERLGLELLSENLDSFESGVRHLL